MADTSECAERYVHGRAGPTVIVPGRIAAILVARAGLAAFHREYRGRDGELDAVLEALGMASEEWRRRHGGRAVPARSPAATLSTTEAAQRHGVTDRAIRRAISDGRLEADRVGNRYVIAADALEHWSAARTRGEPDAA